MWYFTWILGLGLACAFSVLNAIWFEINATDRSGFGDHDDESRS